MRIQSIALLLLLVLVTWVGAEEIKMPIYYPSQSGRYVELTSTDETLLATEPHPQPTPMASYRVSIGTTTPETNRNVVTTAITSRNIQLDVKKLNSGGIIEPGKGNVIADDIFLAKPAYGRTPSVAASPPSPRWASHQLPFYMIPAAIDVPVLGTTQMTGNAMCDTIDLYGNPGQDLAIGGGFSFVAPGIADPSNKSFPITQVNALGLNEAIGWRCQGVDNGGSAGSCYAICLDSVL